VTVPFGKYNGLKLSEVPRSYLDWAISVGPASPAMREFPGSARKFLGMRDAPGKSSGPRRRGGALSDPLSREFLAIVRNG
jgi:hypothetical protein